MLIVEILIWTLLEWLYIFLPCLAIALENQYVCTKSLSTSRKKKKDITVALDRRAVCARRLKDGLCRSLTSVTNNWSMGNIVTLLLITIKEDTNENKHINVVHFNPVVFWHLISSFATEAADITSGYCSSWWRRRNAALRSCWTRCSSNNNDSWLVDVASDADMAWVSVISCGWALGTVAFLKRFAAVDVYGCRRRFLARWYLDRILVNFRGEVAGLCGNTDGT